MKFFKRYINNWFFYTGLIFVIWMIFFDKNNVIEQSKLNNTLHDMDAREAFYKQEIAKTTKEISAYKTDTTLLEKFAREKYYMKKDNEEVFVIVRDKAGNTN